MFKANMPSFMICGIMVSEPYSTEQDVFTQECFCYETLS